MPDILDETLSLTDGRQLAYTDYGDPNGLPIVFLHGNPGSRLMRHPDTSIAKRLGVRIITPDRPGYGGSDFQPNRRLIDFPNDIAQLLDALGIGNFAIFGVSAGSPYVAATAYLYPERVTRAAIVSGAAPFNRHGAYHGVNATFQTMYRMATRLPFTALHPMIRAHVESIGLEPHKHWRKVLHTVSRDDRKVLADLDIQDQVQGYYDEAARHGTRGIAWEAKILGSPWGFPLEQIEPEIDLWYWEADPITPPQMGRYLDQKIPHTVAHFLPNGGHYAIFTYWEEILQDLTRPKAVLGTPQKESA